MSVIVYISSEEKRFKLPALSVVAGLVELPVAYRVKDLIEVIQGLADHILSEMGVKLIT